MFGNRAHGLHGTAKLIKTWVLCCLGDGKDRPSDGLDSGFPCAGRVAPGHHTAPSFSWVWDRKVDQMSRWSKAREISECSVCGRWGHGDWLPSGERNRADSELPRQFHLRSLPGGGAHCARNRSGQKQRVKAG